MESGKRGGESYETARESGDQTFFFNSFLFFFSPSNLSWLFREPPLLSVCVLDYFISLLVLRSTKRKSVVVDEIVRGVFSLSFFVLG